MPDLHRGVRGLKLARIPQSERAVVSAEVLQAYDRSLELFARQGAALVDIDLPFALGELSTWNMRIMSAESYAILHALIDDPASPLDPDVRPRIAAGRTLTARDYLEALAVRDTMKSSWTKAMQGIDALLTPTAATTALPLEDVDQAGTPGHFTRFANFLELCALALPNGLDTAGLPTSLQIVCRGYDEATALRIGQSWQDATDWHLKRPAI
jgi:aspartyl-tRNA(Asn)/glutamyl-tRNA(Gln) amidotransferase subunit A